MENISVESLIQFYTDESQVAVVVFTGNSSKTYSYKILKSWNVTVGNKLIVDSPISGLTVVEVKQVHSLLLTENLEIKYKWALGKVDFSLHATLTRRDERLREAVKEIERKRKEAEVRKALIEQVSSWTDEEKAELRKAWEGI